MNSPGLGKRLRGVDSNGQGMLLIGRASNHRKKTTTMAEDVRMVLEGLLRKGQIEDIDFLREGCGC